MVHIDKEEIDPVCPFRDAKLDRPGQIDRGWFAINRVF